MSLHFWGSLACEIEKAKDPNCDAYHLRVSIFALKKCCSEAAVSRKERHTCGQALKVELHRFVGSWWATSREQGVNACSPRTAISQRTQLVLGLATRQSQSLEIVEAMAAVAP